MRSMFLSLQSFPHFSPFPIYNFLVKLTTTDQATTLTPKTIQGRPSFTSITIYHPMLQAQPINNKEEARKWTTSETQRVTREGKMSWQTYVDEHLMCDIDGNGQHLAAAAIVGHDGSPWAKSASFPQVRPHYQQYSIYHIYPFVFEWLLSSGCSMSKAVIYNVIRNMILFWC